MPLIQFVSREFDSNVIDESNSQSKKQFEPRTSIWIGATKYDDSEKVSRNFKWTISITKSFLDSFEIEDNLTSQNAETSMNWTLLRINIEQVIIHNILHSNLRGVFGRHHSKGRSFSVKRNRGCGSIPLATLYCCQNAANSTNAPCCWLAAKYPGLTEPLHPLPHQPNFFDADRSHPLRHVKAAFGMTESQRNLRMTQLISHNSPTIKCRCSRIDIGRVIHVELIGQSSDSVIRRWKNDHESKSALFVFGARINEID
jgi:hypothetical protein